jgi:DNA replication and repair protein RecF
MINSIRLQHFRSYGDATFQLDPSVNIIVGPNASGKTNLLEAILVVARGGSYRVKDADLVQFEADWARLDVQVHNVARIVKMQAQNGFKKTFEIDGAILQRLSQQRSLPVVLFEPDHLQLLSGSPDMRRSFLDDLIEQTEPGFGAIRRHYKRVLAQRNALLKKNPSNLKEQLFVWNLRLSELGGQIARQRAELVATFNHQATDLYSSLAGRDNAITLEYVSKFNPETYETPLLRKLEENIELDIVRGYTVYGPHRDDIAALIDGHPIQEAASRGETRTLVLALKIMELQLLESVRQQKPILLLDDVFSELDARRRQALTQYVQQYQTFITTTDADVVAGYFGDSFKIIDLSA